MDSKKIVRSGNNMSNLLNKIERRLGLAVLPLPEQISKKSWVEVIEQDTIPTFSRYFPHKITIMVDNTCEKNGWYFIDQYLPEGVKILGVKDIDWNAYRTDYRTEGYGLNISDYDMYTSSHVADQIALRQVATDFMSLFDLGIYIEFEYPNKVKLVTSTGGGVSRKSPFPLQILIEHPSNLMTISPTMMESFEKLAMCDVATMIFQQLKYYDGVDTAYVNLDLKLEDLRSWADKREDLLREFDESYVSTANDNQPILLTV